MATFLERYTAGEFEQVWIELVERGEAVRERPLLLDAESVAWETMRRARDNVKRLVRRLGEIGFQFAYEPDPKKRVVAWHGDSYPVHELPRKGTAKLIRQTEADMGPIPLSLRAWWEVVGGVNFIGAHADWPDVEVTDPLVVGSVELLEGLDEQFEEWQEFQEQAAEEGEVGEPFTLDIAPDNYHKANVSGGPPYGVLFPSAKADELFAGGPLTFVQYLRTAFKWGGFPGFEKVKPAKRPADQLCYLTAELLPL